MCGGGAAGGPWADFPPELRAMNAINLWGVDLDGNKEVAFNVSSRPGSVFYIKDQIFSGTLPTSSPMTDVLDNLKPTTKFTIPSPLTYLSGASTNLDAFSDLVDDLSNDIVLDNAQDSLELDLEDQHLRSVNRMAAGFADINATNSSAFFISMALLESEKSRNLVKARADWALKDRYTKLEMIDRLFHNRLEYGKTVITALTDEISHHIEMLTSAYKWSLNVAMDVSTMLAALTGASVHESPKENKLASALSGTLGGAAMGAIAGNMISPAANGAAWGSGGGPIGLGIGAAAGLLYGLFS